LGNFGRIFTALAQKQLFVSFRSQLWYHY